MTKTFQIDLSDAEQKTYYLSPYCINNRIEKLDISDQRFSSHEGNILSIFLLINSPKD